MCGRYNLIDSPLVQALLEELGINFNIEPRYNLAPTDAVPIIVQQDDQYQVMPMCWWLIPRWSQGSSSKYAMFNARCESLRSSRAYAKPFLTQRGIIPASSFIEWQKTAVGKQALMIESANHPLALAAIWDCWDGPERQLLSCSIITQPASSEFAAIHQRMPHILRPVDYGSWLNPDTPVEQIDEIVSVPTSTSFIVTPISAKVNNARNKSSASIEVEGGSYRIGQ